MKRQERQENLSLKKEIFKDRVEISISGYDTNKKSLNPELLPTRRAQKSIPQINNLFHQETPSFKVRFFDPMHSGSSYHVYMSKEAPESHSSTTFTDMLHFAFAEHLKVKFTPDDIHLIILQAITYFTQAYPDEFRTFFTDKDTKQEIEIRNDELSPYSNKDDSVQWKKVPMALVQEAAKNVKNKDILDILQQDYTTSTEEDKLIKRVTLLGTLSPYFTFAVATLCFIPGFILMGTAEDWKKLSELPDKLITLLQLQELDTSKMNSKSPNPMQYFKKWLEILRDNFLAHLDKAFDPKLEADINFWANMYKWQAESGGSAMTGRASILYPLLYNSGRKNYFLNRNLLEQNNFYISTKNLPASSISVGFLWNYFNSQYCMNMKAGMFAIELGKDRTLSLHKNYSIYFKNKEYMTKILSYFSNLSLASCVSCEDDSDEELTEGSRLLQSKKLNQ